MEQICEDSCEFMEARGAYLESVFFFLSCCCCFLVEMHMLFNPKRKSRSLEKRSFKQLVIFKYMHHEKKQTLLKKSKKNQNR